MSVDQSDCENGSIDEVGRESAFTKSGNFVPDHQPPSKLNPNNKPQRLYPHRLTRFIFYNVKYRVLYLKSHIETGYLRRPLELGCSRVHQF